MNRHRPAAPPGPDAFPSTSGNEFAPFQRQHDVQAAPQRTGAIVATTLGSLLLLALVLRSLLP
ncbi:hypothetical protein [Kineococcus indalonis]|uniref:hypothetical protein n=1 Tax=Kineococcus indalonis TaxID=2696566 RepID=UPI0014120434|nr:hypothetical protein [Kineococcus indalonis]NAZ84987.1 hypothetical protein [Kineococcus indalonis]